MNKKRFVILVIVYAIVLFALTIFLSINYYNNLDLSSSTSSVKTGMGLLIEDVGNRLNAINFTELFKPLEKRAVNKTVGGGLLLKNCDFKTDLYCEIFQPDKRSGQFLFNFRNDLDKKIVVTGADITGGTTCSLKTKIVVNKYEDFYMVIKGCRTTSTEADMIVYYYNDGSSPEFIHSIKGRLAVR